ncbi:MAG: metallophosphoesterase, partial [Sediminibacterium sp.]
MRNSGVFWVIALIMLLLDYYVFQAVKVVTQPLSERWRIVVHYSYWVVSVLTIAALLSFPFIQALQSSRTYRNYIFAILVGLFLAKLVGSFIFFTDDIRRVLPWAVNKAIRIKGNTFVGENGDMMSRSTFLSWAGLGLGGTLFGTLLMG